MKANTIVEQHKMTGIYLDGMEVLEGQIEIELDTYGYDNYDHYKENRGEGWKSPTTIIVRNENPPTDTMISNVTIQSHIGTRFEYMSVPFWPPTEDQSIQVISSERRLSILLLEGMKCVGRFVINADRVVYYGIYDGG